MKMGNFPLMRSFLAGAFSANSGGTCRPEEPIRFGNPEEYAAAEKWLGEFCSMMNSLHQTGCAHGLGMLADEGQAVCGHFYTEGNMWEVDPTDSLQLAPPWLILNRFY